MQLTPAPLTTPAPKAPVYAAQWASAPVNAFKTDYFMGDLRSTSDPARLDLITRCANSSLPAVMSEFIVPLVSYSPDNPLVSPVSQVCQDSWCVSRLALCPSAYVVLCCLALCPSGSVALCCAYSSSQHLS